MKIKIYRADEVVFSGDVINLRRFFKEEEKQPKELNADRTEIYMTGEDEPTDTVPYKEFTALLE